MNWISLGWKKNSWSYCSGLYFMSSICSNLVAIKSNSQVGPGNIFLANRKWNINIKDNVEMRTISVMWPRHSCVACKSQLLHIPASMFGLDRQVNTAADDNHLAEGEGGGTHAEWATWHPQLLLLLPRQHTINKFISMFALKYIPDGTHRSNRSWTNLGTKSLNWLLQTNNGRLAFYLTTGVLEPIFYLPSTLDEQISCS